jgi:hypothetical protein
MIVARRIGAVGCDECMNELIYHHKKVKEERLTDYIGPVCGEADSPTEVLLSVPVGNVPPLSTNTSETSKAANLVAHEREYLRSDLGGQRVDSLQKMMHSVIIVAIHLIDIKS